MINVFEPSLGKEELKAIEEVFRNKWIGKSKQALKFEKRFAESLEVDSKHFTSTTCCTEALFLAGELFKFSPADEIIAPAISFNAVGNAVVAHGAKLVVCDVDPHTLNVTAEHIKPHITSRTKALMINHYGGVPCDMDPILKLCRKHNIAVIEDSACAVHSFYKGRAAGTLGDMGTWSFDAMKTVCTGDGGMIYLKDSDKMMNHAKEHLYMGLPNRQKSGIDSAGTGAAQWWEFEITRPGRRAILNNIAGAMGVEQLKKLPKFLARRKEIHKRYMKELKGLKWLTLPPELPDNVTSSYYFFWVQCEQRNELAKFLKARNIYTTFRYLPLNRIKFFGLSEEATPNAIWAADRTLNIPLHQSLNDSDVSLIIKSIKKFGEDRGL